MEPTGGWPTDGRNATGNTLVPLRKTSDIQTRLKELGFYTGPIDEDYGPGTSAADAKFQQTRWLLVDGHHGLTTDGIMFPPAGAVFGVDYSWARPGGAFLKNRGVNFAGRYLWAHEGNKGIGRAELEDLWTNNIDPYFFYETWAEDSMVHGYSKGVEHAKVAQGFLDKLGIPDGIVHLNVDHAVTSDQLPAILEGMRGAASVLGTTVRNGKTVQRAAIYGQYEVVKAVLDAGYTYACQTYAWSRGQWDPRATVRQWSNGQWGDSVDFNWSMATDFGQASKP